MHGKQYSLAQNAELRELVRTLVEQRFDGNKSRAAAALGVTGAALGEFLSGKRGIGNKFLEGLAKVTDRSRSDLLGEDEATTEPAWANLPGYRESERQLRTEAPHRYSEAVYMKGRRLRGVRPLELPVTVAALRRLLTWIEENASLEELATLEEERIDKQLAKDIKSAETRAKNKAAKAAEAAKKAPKLPAGNARR